MQIISLAYDIRISKTIPLFGFSFSAGQTFYENSFGGYTVTGSIAETINFDGTKDVVTISNGSPSISASLFDDYDISFNGQNIFNSLSFHIKNGTLKVSIGFRTLSLKASSDEFATSVTITITKSGSLYAEPYDELIQYIGVEATGQAFQASIPTMNTIITRGLQADIENVGEFIMNGLEEIVGFIQFY